MLSDNWLSRNRLLENFNKVERERETGTGNGNGNAYDRGDYNSSFAFRAVELKIIKEFFSNISPNTSLIIPFQLTQVSSFYLEYFLRYGIYKISFRFVQRAVILQRGDNSKKKFKKYASAIFP